MPYPLFWLCATKFRRQLPTSRIKPVAFGLVTKPLVHDFNINVFIVEIEKYHNFSLKNLPGHAAQGIPFSIKSNTQLEFRRHYYY